MDMGAHGVIVPMVNNKNDAVRAVNAVKYPPLGNRGVGLARAQGYGMEFEKYRDWVNKYSVVIAQIEHISAVENLKDILSVEGIDGFIVGPYDLSASLGRPGDFGSPDMRQALKDILATSKKIKKPAGFHVIQPDADDLLNKIKEGYKFLGFSLDTLFLGESISGQLNKIQKGLRK
jgi:2-dehydro-3-deoxyglucarate aldolase